MSASKRNFMWPILVLALGGLLFAVSVDALPTNADDLLQRAWPILLVIAGLNMFLIDRVRFGNWLALGLSIGILAGVVFAAYYTQADTLRDENQVEIAPILLGPNISELTLDIQTQETTITLLPAPDRSLAAQFSGSTESEVQLTAQEDAEGVLHVIVNETQPNFIPRLDAIGRGSLTVSLPSADADAPLRLSNLSLSNQAGGITLDLRSLALSRLDIANQVGDVDLLLPSDSTIIGDIQIESGDLQLVLDPQVMIEISGVSGESILDDAVYLRLQGGVIESRGMTAGQAQIRLTLDLGNGALRIVPSLP